MGEQLTQTVTLLNDGNMDMGDLVLTLRVEGSDGIPVTIRDTIPGISVSNTFTHPFSRPYTVPISEYGYGVMVTVEPLCNSGFVFGDT
jgi:hypothetical protein